LRHHTFFHRNTHQSIEKFSFRWVASAPLGASRTRSAKLRGGTTKQWRVAELLDRKFGETLRYEPIAKNHDAHVPDCPLKTSCPDAQMYICTTVRDLVSALARHLSKAFPPTWGLWPPWGLQTSLNEEAWKASGGYWVAKCLL
jgi:hypothetical protein